MSNEQAISITTLQDQAEAGDAQAQFELALCHTKGEGTTRTALAVQWLGKAASQNHTEAQYALGLYYLADQKHPLLLELWADEFKKNIANQIATDSTLNLAVWLAVASKFAHADDNLAFMWLEKAVGQNCAAASYWLGICYRDGIGTFVDERRAFECFKRGGEQSYPYAYASLAMCYQEGKGTERDCDNASVWASKAIKFFENNHTQMEWGKEALASAYYIKGTGLETHSSYQDAVDAYCKSAELNNAEAKYRLARCYDAGLGVEKDIQSASNWYWEAAQAGIFQDADKQFSLAKTFLNGLGIKKDFETGINWLMEAIKNQSQEAEAWLIDALLKLAFPYLYAINDAKREFERAVQWCEEVIDKDEKNCEANFALGVLYAAGKGCQQDSEKASKYFNNLAENLEYDDSYEGFWQVAHLYKYLHFCKRGLRQEAERCREQVWSGDAGQALIDHVYPKRAFTTVLLPWLRVDIHLRREEFDEAKAFIQGIYQNASIRDKEFKHVCLTAIEKSQQIEEKNQKLAEAQNELQELMAMFAHKFRSPLDAIIYNTTHDHQVKLYTEAAQTMRGLLDVFSIISTDPERLRDRIRQDIGGEASLSSVVLKTLDMLMLHLLSPAGTEKIHQHYLASAEQQGLCPSGVSRKSWREDYYELERRLRTEWEQSFAELLSQPEDWESRQQWIESRFFRLELRGFDPMGIRFRPHGAAESFLVILLNEVLVNAFKYYSSATQQPVVLEWAERDGYHVLTCRNPSVRSERMAIKGSGKGHTFLSTLARKTGSHFDKPKHQDDFVLEFVIPGDLFTTN